MTTGAARAGGTERDERPRTDIGSVPATVMVHGSVPSGLEAVTGGATAAALAELYDAARDAVVAAETAAGGGVLVVVTTDEPRHGRVIGSAVAAMGRSLAREYGHAGVRVNAVITTGSQPDALIAFVAGPAAALLTGAVFDAR